MAKTSTARHPRSHLGYCLLYWLCFICQTLSLLKGDRSFHWHWVESFQNTGWPGHLITTSMNIKYNYIISWVVFIPHSATLLWLDTFYLVLRKYSHFFKYLPLFVPPHWPDETCPLTTWLLIFATALINKQTSVVQRTSTFMRNRSKGHKTTDQRMKHV